MNKVALSSIFLLLSGLNSYTFANGSNGTLVYVRKSTVNSSILAGSTYAIYEMALPGGNSNLVWQWKTHDKRWRVDALSIDSTAQYVSFISGPSSDRAIMQNVTESKLTTHLISRQLYVVDIRTKRHITLEMHEPIVRYEWSPRQSQILIETIQQNKSILYLVDPTLTPFKKSRVNINLKNCTWCWAGDGRGVIIGNDMRHVAALHRLPTGVVLKSWRLPAVHTSYLLYPSPNGRQLLWIGNDPISNNPIINVGSKIQRRITDDHARLDADQVFWSPNSKRFALHTYSLYPENGLATSTDHFINVWEVGANHWMPKQIAWSDYYAPPYKYLLLGWTKGQNKLVISRNTSEGSTYTPEIIEYDPQTGRKTVVAGINGNVQDIAWQAQ